MKTFDSAPAIELAKKDDDGFSTSSHGSEKGSSKGRNDDRSDDREDNRRSRRDDDSKLARRREQDDDRSRRRDDDDDRPRSRNHDDDDDRPRSRNHDDDDNRPRSRNHRDRERRREWENQDKRSSNTAAWVIPTVIVSVGLIGVLIYTLTRSKAPALADNRFPAADSKPNVEQPHPFPQNNPPRPPIPFNDPPKLQVNDELERNVPVPDGLPFIPGNDPPGFPNNRPRFEQPAQPIGDAPVFHPVAPVAFAPAPLKQDKTELSLPATITDVCLAGGGRYLALYLSQQRKIAIFDSAEARIVHYFPVPAASVKIAGSMEKLFVADPDTNTIQRWDLATHEKELTLPLPEKRGRIDAIVTGYGAAGPILVGVCGDRRSRGGSGFFIDPKTLKEVTPRWGGKQLPGLTPYLARASSDGRTFVVHDGFGGEPHAMKVFVFNGATATLTGEVWPANASIGNPSTDGTLIHTAGGVYTPELKPVGGENNVSSLPARHGAMSIHLNPSGDRFGIPGRSQKSAGSITFHLPRDNRVLAKLNDVEGVSHEGVGYGGSSDPINHDKRIHYIPGANLVVAVPSTNDKLILYRFDFEQSIEKSGIDYLYVGSTPKTIAGRGTEYSYAISVKSKKGGVKIKLDSGPKGMKVNADGKLIWNVPAQHADSEVDVLLTVSDSTGQELFHSFKIHVLNAKDVPPETPVPVVRPQPVVDDKSRKDVVTLPSDTTSDGPFGIKPPPLGNSPLTVDLKSAYSDFCLGGGGRYFFFFQKSERRLAVFDVNEAKVIKELPMPEDGAQFAAGLEHLFVYAPQAGAIQRWSLKTFEKEFTQPFDAGGATINYLRIGIAAPGPLVAIGNGKARNSPLSGTTVNFIDTKTLKPLGISPGQLVGGFAGDDIRVSADGRVYTSRNRNYSPQGIRVGVLGENELTVISQHDTAGTLIPNEDGSVVYSVHGQISRQGKRLGSRIGQSSMQVPSVHGKYYAEFAVNHPFAFQADAPDRAAVYYQSVDKPLLSINFSAQIYKRSGDNERKEFQLAEQRVHVIPAAKSVVVLPQFNNKVVLYPADLEAAAEKEGINMMAVTSTPPTAFKKGARFSYQVRVRSSKGGIKARLESGPTGMKLNPDGTLTWDVPANFADSNVSVILTISDASETEVFHTFAIRES